MHHSLLFIIIHYPCKVIACLERVTLGNESGNKEKKSLQRRIFLSYIYIIVGGNEKDTVDLQRLSRVPCKYISL